MKGLYIHIPFCVKKCSYCDFYSLPNRQYTIASYVQAILKEAESYTDSNFPSFVKRAHPSCGRIEGDLFPPLNPSQSTLLFQTLYIGGGTPSLLGPKNLTTLITGLNNIFVIPAKAGIHSSVGSGFGSLSNFARNGEILSTSVEMYDHQARRETEVERGNMVSPLAPCGRESDRGINDSTDNPLSLRLVEGRNTFAIKAKCIESTIELNPESATSEFLQTVKNLGFNRLSFGIQSLNDKELQSVGRIHTAAQAVAAIKQAQKLNFPAISADLIIGLPGQTSASLHKSLQTLVEMGVQHLSVYCLSLEAGTPLANNPPPDLPSDDIQASLFEETRNYLITCGFAHYEISNFALPGYECLHNLNYWRGGEYLGLGPAAASHLQGKRFKNRTNLDAYLQNPTGQIEDIEELAAKDKAAEEAMLRLRLLEEGLNTDELTAKFGPANTADIIRRLNKMVQEGLLLQTDNAYRLEPSRILTSNPIFARVLQDSN